MRLVLVLVFFGVGSIAAAQQYSNFELLERSVTEKSEAAPARHGVGQFLDQCIFEERCGVFLKNSFKEYGIIKATFLSIDRRLRCTSLNKSQTFPHLFNEDGLIIDYAKDYRSPN